MAEKARTCPECNGQVLFRLGEWQCQQCPYTVAGTAGDSDDGPSFGGATLAPGESAGVYGLQNKRHTPPKLKPSLNDPGLQYREEAAPPPPGMPGATLGSSPQDYYEGAVRDLGSDPLKPEKLMFLGVMAFAGLLAAYFAWGPAMNQPLLMILGPGAYWLVAALGVAVLVGIYAVVLFIDLGWMKWGIMYAVSIGILLSIAAYIFHDALLGQLLYIIYESPVSSGLMMSVHGWLVFILWRDIRRL